MTITRIPPITPPTYLAIVTNDDVGEVAAQIIFILNISYLINNYIS